MKIFFSLVGVIFFIFILRILIENDGLIDHTDNHDYKKIKAVVLEISDQKHETIISTHWCVKVKSVEDSTILYGITYNPVLKNQMVYYEEWLDTVSNEIVHNKSFKPIYE